MNGWVQFEERQPPKYGRYRVIRRVRSGKTEEDEYLWNGSGWVTHGGSLSKAVVAWKEAEGVEDT